MLTMLMETSLPLLEIRRCIPTAKSSPPSGSPFTTLAFPALHHLMRILWLRPLTELPSSARKTDNSGLDLVSRNSSSRKPETPTPTFRQHRGMEALEPFTD